MVGLSDPKPVLVWRSSETTGEMPDVVLCPYCQELLVRSSSPGDELFGGYRSTHCYFCGWWWRWEGEGFCVHALDEDVTNRSVLTELDVAATELSFRELSATLALDPLRALHLDPRQFEMYVGDLYRNIGFDVVVTAKTKDLGRDLIMLSRSDGKSTIVEVKRRKDRIGVELIRQLRGVQLRDNAQHAVLVAVAGFTTEARAEATSANATALGFKMSLVELSQLLDEAGLTNEPLESATAADRDRRAYRNWLVEAHPEAVDMARQFEIGTPDRPGAVVDGTEIQGKRGIGRSESAEGVYQAGHRIQTRWADGTVTYEPRSEFPPRTAYWTKAYERPRKT